MKKATKVSRRTFFYWMFIREFLEPEKCIRVVKKLKYRLRSTYAKIY